jgi:hypothetical protein
LPCEVPPDCRLRRRTERRTSQILILDVKII